MTYFSLVSLALVDEAEYSSLCTLCVNKLEHFQWRLKDTKLKNFNEILVELKKNASTTDCTQILQKEQK